MNDLGNSVVLCSIILGGNNISRSCPLLLGYMGLIAVRIHFAFLDDFLPGFWPLLMVWKLVTVIYSPIFIRISGNYFYIIFLQRRWKCNMPSFAFYFCCNTIE